MKDKRAITNWLFLLAAGAAWGGSISLTKIAADSGYHSITLLFWQLCISIVFLLGWLFYNRITLPLTPGHLVFYVLAGMLGSAVPDSLAYFIAPNLPAGVISIVYALVPMMTFALAVLFRSEKFELIRFAGVLLGFIAILLLVAPEFGERPAGSVFWILLLVLAGFCYAAESVFATFYMPQKDHPLTILTGMSIAALVVVTSLMFARDIPFTVQKLLGKSEWALIVSSFIHVAAYAGYLHLLRHTGAIFASQIAYIVTLTGVFWGMLVFTESHSLWTWASLAVAIAGLALVRQRPQTLTANSEPHKP